MVYGLRTRVCPHLVPLFGLVQWYAFVTRLRCYYVIHRRGKFGFLSVRDTYNVRARAPPIAYQRYGREK